MPEACSEIIDDIEDLVASQDIQVRERKGVTVRVKRKKKEVLKPSEDSEEVCENELESRVPGTESIYVKTWGCTHNTSDSEYMAGLLSAYGYTITDDPKSAHLWLLNSCTVKNPAEDHFRNEVVGASRAHKPVVVSGCVPQGAPRAPYLRGVSMLGVQQIDRVVEVVEQTLAGNCVRLLGERKVDGKKTGGAPLALPKVRRNPLVEIIPISTGCLNQCTYCKTKHARGHLGSYPPEEIVSRVKEAVSEGVREVWITSEDTGAYGRDLDSSLPALIRAVLPHLPDHTMLRIGMTNPPYIMDHLEEMCDLLNHPRIYSFLHVPVQSGSDAVLRDMKREYTSDQFSHLVDFVSKRVPDVNIITDIICGFPTETEEDFDETMRLCKRHKFASLFINQFYPRPGTPAANMPRIPAQQVKERTKRLSELFLSYEPLSGLEGCEKTVLVTELSKDGLHYVGHDKSYHQVLVRRESGTDLLGCWLKVRVDATTRHSMTASLITVLPSGAVRPTVANPVPGTSLPPALSIPRQALFVLLFLAFLRLYYVFIKF